VSFYSNVAINQPSGCELQDAATMWSMLMRNVMMEIVRTKMGVRTPAYVPVAVTIFSTCLKKSVMTEMKSTEMTAQTHAPLRGAVMESLVRVKPVMMATPLIWTHVPTPAIAHDAATVLLARVRRAMMETKSMEMDVITIAIGVRHAGQIALRLIL